MRDVLVELLSEKYPPGNKGTLSEMRGTTLIMHSPACNLVASPTRKFNYAYNLMESIWNLTDTRELYALKLFNSKIENFVQDQDEWNRDEATWAYGPYSNPQMRWVMRELLQDSGSRRANISVVTGDALEYGGLAGTPPCLVSSQFLIRDGWLHQFVTMRSNDAWLGLPLDLMQFSFWGQMLSAYLSIPFGSYTHHVASLHLYRRDVEAAQKFIDGGLADSHIGGITSMVTPPPGKNALPEVLDGLAYGVIVGDLPIEVLSEDGIRGHVSMLVGGIMPYGYQWMKKHGHGIGWPKPAMRLYTSTGSPLHGEGIVTNDEGSSCEPTIDSTSTQVQN